MPTHTRHRLFISSLAQGAGPGLYSAFFDTPTAQFSSPSPIQTSLSNTFILTCSPDRTRLYAAEIAKDHPGAIHAFSLSPDHPHITLLASQPALEPVPCFIGITSDGQTLFIAGYSQGGIASHRITPGSPLSAGVYAIPPAPGKPRAHCAIAHPSAPFLVSAFLGLDQITCHRLSGDAHSPVLTHTLQLPPKSCPRHLAWHPTQNLLLAITELSNQALVIAFDPAAASLTLLDSVHTVPADFIPASRGADIAIHPAGSLVFASNRGHDSISAFRLDPLAGKLSLIDYFPATGRAPQSIKFTPCGEYLLCANLKSNEVTPFKVAPTTGSLTPAGAPLAIASPSCILFA